MSTKEKQRLTLFLHPDLIKHARAQAVVQGVTLTSLVENALTSYLPKQIVIKNPLITVK